MPDVGGKLVPNKWLFLWFLPLFLNFLLFKRFCLLERERECACTEGEGEADSLLSREPDTGLDPGTLRSCPEPKADAYDQATQAPLFFNFLNNSVRQAWLLSPFRRENWGPGTLSSPSKVTPLIMIEQDPNACHPGPEPVSSAQRLLILWCM